MCFQDTDKVGITKTLRVYLSKIIHFIKKEGGITILVGKFRLTVTKNFEGWDLLLFRKIFAQRPPPPPHPPPPPSPRKDANERKILLKIGSVRSGKSVTVIVGTFFSKKRRPKRLRIYQKLLLFKPLNFFGYFWINSIPLKSLEVLQSIRVSTFSYKVNWLWSPRKLWLCESESKY